MTFAVLGQIDYTQGRPCTWEVHLIKARFDQGSFTIKAKQVLQLKNLHSVYVSGCPPYSHMTTEGNLHTMQDDEDEDHDYFFYVFTQEKESNSPFVYLLYKYDCNKAQIKQVLPNTRDAIEEDFASVDAMGAFQQAISRSKLSPEWKEHIDRLELKDD